MQQKAHFLTAIPQAMTARPAGHAPVPPVMSRSSVTAAAAVKNRQSVKNTVMHMRGLIITDFSYYKILKTLP